MCTVFQKGSSQHSHLLSDEVVCTSQSETQEKAISAVVNFSSSSFIGLNQEDKCKFDKTDETSLDSFRTRSF